MAAAQKRRPPDAAQTAFQRLKEMLKWVDLVVEVVDARVPLSTVHPKSQEIFGQKPRLTIFTKEDLADEAVVAKHISGFAALPNRKAMSLSLKVQKGKERVLALALQLTKEKRESIARRGLLPRPVRICVVGMPNVGKSSFINWLVGRKKAKVGDTPGVTKGTQWVRVHPQIELLDTPGILPPFTLNKRTALKLAFLNLLPPHTYDHEQVASDGLALLAQEYPELLSAYLPNKTISELSLTDIAQARNMLGTGGKFDTSRAAITLLQDVRSGKIGRITLDAPETT